MEDPKLKATYPRQKTLSNGGNVVDRGAEGVTLREYYAGQFMAALLGKDYDCTPRELAKDAVRLADHLIEELEATSFK